MMRHIATRHEVGRYRAIRSLCLTLLLVCVDESFCAPPAVPFWLAEPPLFISSFYYRQVHFSTFFLYEHPYLLSPGSFNYRLRSLLFYCPIDDIFTLCIVSEIYV